MLRQQSCDAVVGAGSRVAVRHRDRLCRRAAGHVHLDAAVVQSRDGNGARKKKSAGDCVSFCDHKLLRLDCVVMSKMPVARYRDFGRRFNFIAGEFRPEA